MNGRNRVVLNTALATEIYWYKLMLTMPTTFKSSLQGTHFIPRGASRKLAVNYGVSAKTIRDIWNRKSWVKATLELETQYYNTIFEVK